jgi:beta-glucosidase
VLHTFRPRRGRDAPKLATTPTTIEQLNCVRVSNGVPGPQPPQTLYWGTRQLVDVWGAKEIFVTESGLPTTDAGDAGGDVDRIVWLRAYLTLQRATAEGVPVRGWFHWSTMDNLEWIFGHEPKFGLFRVEAKTLKRTPKMSASWFRETARRNAVA